MSNRMESRLATVVAALGIAVCGLAPEARADVLVVDKSGAGDFEIVQFAVNAAADGDVILVKPGNHNAFFEAVTIDDKALTIVGDVGGSSILTRIGIVNLSPGKTVVLSNLELGPTGHESNLVIDDCHGAIIVEQCLFDVESGEFPANVGQPGNDGKDSMVIRNSTGVSIHRSLLLGGDGQVATNHPNGGDPAGSGGLGLRVENSEIALFSCFIRGGDGGDVVADPALLPVDAGKGAHGIVADGSVIHMTGSEVVGGDSGDGCSIASAGACRGGDGIAVLGPSTIRTIDSTITGGSGGLLDEGGPAPDGASVSGPGTLVALPGDAYAVAISAPIREGETGIVSFNGPANAAYGLFFSLEGGFLPTGGPGVYVPALPVAGPLILGIAPQGGDFVLPFTAPQLGPAFEEVTLVTQMFVEGAGGLVLSSASVPIILDSQF